MNLCAIQHGTNYYNVISYFHIPLVSPKSRREAKQSDEPLLDQRLVLTKANLKGCKAPRQAGKPKKITADMN